MKVGYDGGSLGLGHAGTTHRWGIFRVARRVARGLATSGECERPPSAVESTRTYGHAVEYARSVLELRAVPFTPVPAGAAPVRWLGRAFQAHVGPGASVPAKLVRRSLLHGRQAAERVLRAAAPPALSGGEVFHSPRLAVPHPSRTGPADRLVAVRDLVFILFTHLSSPFGVRELREMLGSPRADDVAIVISGRTCAPTAPTWVAGRVVVVRWAAESELFHPVDDEARRHAGPLRRSRGVVPARPEHAGAPQEHGAHATVVRRSGDRTTASATRRSCWRARAGCAPGACTTRPPRRAGRIVRTSYVGDEDLAALPSVALAFVYPSQYGGAGPPPLEAMQCGTPVVTATRRRSPRRWATRGWP